MPLWPEGDQLDARFLQWSCGPPPQGTSRGQWYAYMVSCWQCIHNCMASGPSTTVRHAIVRQSHPSNFFIGSVVSLSTSLSSSGLSSSTQIPLCQWSENPSFAREQSFPWPLAQKPFFLFVLPCLKSWRFSKPTSRTSQNLVPLSSKAGRAWHSNLLYSKETKGKSKLLSLYVKRIWTPTVYLTWRHSVCSPGMLV